MENYDGFWCIRLNFPSSSKLKDLLTCSESTPKTGILKAFGWLAEVVRAYDASSKRVSIPVCLYEAHNWVDLPECPTEDIDIEDINGEVNPFKDHC